MEDMEMHGALYLSEDRTYLEEPRTYLETKKTEKKYVFTAQNPYSEIRIRDRMQHDCTVWNSCLDVF